MTTIYDRMLFNTQDKLEASINQIRSSIPHAGEIGTLNDVHRHIKCKSGLLRETKPEEGIV